MEKERWMNNGREGKLDGKGKGRGGKRDRERGRGSELSSKRSASFMWWEGGRRKKR